MAKWLTLAIGREASILHTGRADLSALSIPEDGM